MVAFVLCGDSLCILWDVVSTVLKGGFVHDSHEIEFFIFMSGETIQRSVHQIVKTEGRLESLRLEAQNVRRHCLEPVPIAATVILGDRDEERKSEEVQ